MEIGQSTWSHQTVVLSERRFQPDGIFMSIIGRVTLQTRMFAVRRWRCCKAAAVTNFPFEGHCAMTNADEANEVQENAVTAKREKSEA